MLRETVTARTGTWRRWIGAASLLIAATAVGAVIWDRHQDAQARAVGASIFTGQTDIGGRLANHTQDLPAAATACVNCHEKASTAPRAAAANSAASSAVADGVATPSPANSLAVSIRGKALTEVRSRRGGPPSRIDEAGLCKLLRTGIDPAQVMVATAMPRYQPTERQCHELWAFLAET